MGEEEGEEVAGRVAVLGVVRRRRRFAVSGGMVVVVERRWGVCR